MKSLIAVVNARHRNEWREAIRATWMRQVPGDKADAFFFMGRGEPKDMHTDEVELDCSDKYEHLPEKVRSMCRWALQREYHHMLKCDDDVVLKPNTMLASGYEQYHFSGKGNRPPQPYVVSFGFNYWLSRTAMQYIAETPLPEDGSNDDEKWVARTLWQNGIALHNVDRYKLHQTWELSPAAMFKRPLRVPRRMEEETKDPQMFSRCIHIEQPNVPTDVKVEEFHKVFKKYGEK